MEGYRNVLNQIYGCDAYYERAKLFLSRCQPGRQRRLSYDNVRAFFASVMHQGVFGKARLSYWKFVPHGRHPLPPIVRHSHDAGRDGISLPDAHGTVD